MSRNDEIVVARTVVNMLLEIPPRVNCSRRVKVLSVVSNDWPFCKAHEWARLLLMLPADAEIVRVTDSDYKMKTDIYIRSMEFPEVPGGDDC